MEPQQQPQHRLFTKAPPVAQQGLGGKEIMELRRQLRSLEQRIANLQRRLQVNEQNLLGYERKTHSDERTQRDEIRDVRREMDEIKDVLSTVTKELRRTASREDVQILKKYLDFWQPVKFVTQEQVERIVADYLGKERGKAGNVPRGGEKPGQGKIAES